MNSRQFVVRLVKPSVDPSLPKTNLRPSNSRKKTGPFLSKTMNILIGSGVGLAAGTVIYLMLKIIGLDIGGMESSVIIGLPSLLIIMASFVIC